MKKILLFISIVIAFSIVVTSCNNQKTAQELMKEENKAIDRFIHKNGFKVLKEYPEDGVFGENEYFHDANGLYIHVIDSGNGNKAKVYQTITARYTGLLYFKTDTAKSTPHFAGTQPDEFIYGISASYGGKYTYDQTCSGWAIALGYVSEGAKVNVIVPSAIGTPSDQSNYRPVYYENLKFRFY